MSLWPQAVAAARKDMVKAGVFAQRDFVLMNKGRKGEKWYRAAKERYAKMRK